ncbi:MAG: Transposase [Verrucomicrobiota bacterium]
MVERELGEPSAMKFIRFKAVETRRKFDETFKRETLNNWLASGKSAEVVGQELGLTSNRLYAWRKGFAPGTAGGEEAPGAKAPFLCPFYQRKPKPWNSRTSSAISLNDNTFFSDSFRLASSLRTPFW